MVSNKSIESVEIIDQFSSYLEYQIYMKKIVHKCLYSFMTTHSLLNMKQYGFRKGYSTINAITKFTYDTLHVWNSENLNLSVLLDLSKAFDTINHSLLCTQLHHYGIHRVTMEWSRGYLSERKPYVSYYGTD